MSIHKLPLGQKSFEIACPICKRTRIVSRHQALLNLARPQPCRSCSRKAIRKGMTFPSIACRLCGKTFIRTSGATKTCPECKKPAEPRACPVCGQRFTGYASKKACSQACLRRLRNNSGYFGGNYFQAEGWAERECQVCHRRVEKGGSVHHVFGHPNHDALVFLCPGCHHLVGQLTQRRNLDLHYLLLLTAMNRAGHGRWTVTLKVEEYSEEEWATAVEMGIVVEAPSIGRAVQVKPW